MKVFGYLDDFVLWFFNWQVSMGWWNAFIIPLELFFFYTYIYRRFFYQPATYVG